ncbi:MAG: FadR family transcriptional regulator [Deltaproteobacteria bacterium]|nr:FadR family transcriptional regulator [Deltaproteobacteria bacterium]
MLKPIERRSLADAVYEQLRDAIVSGDLEPGSSLPSERQLREQLGVNRGALREALKRLEEARLVRIRHGGATEVLDFREHAGTSLLEDLLVAPDGSVRTRVARGVIEMRAALAPDIARLAALRGGPDCTERLAEQLVALREADGVLNQQRVALEFWATLVDASDNLAYRLAYNSLREGYVRFMHLLSPVLADEVGDVDAYQSIADAVAAGESEAAYDQAKALLARGTGTMTALMDAVGRQQTETP